MTEITERFLQEIAARVGYYKVAEVHLFPPIKQSGQESGVAVIAATPETAPAEGGLERHVVYTARYRQTFKGPDRGKWEFDIKAEADAPLITVDEVVRGVVRRSGDDVSPDRMTGEQFRESVAVPEGQEPPEEPLAEVPEPLDVLSEEESSEESREEVPVEASEEALAESSEEFFAESSEDVSDDAFEEPSAEDSDELPVAEAPEDTGDDVTSPELSPEDPEPEQVSPEPDDTRLTDNVHA